MVFQLDSHALEPLHLPDVQGGLFWPWAFAQALLDGEPLYWRTDLQWPDGQDLRPIIWNHAIQFLLFPLFAVCSPLQAINLSALWIAALNGLCGAWAGLRVTGQRLGGLVGLSVAIGAPYGLVEAGVGRPEQGLWGPLAVACGALVGLLDTPQKWSAAWTLGISVGVAGAIYWFYGIFVLSLAVVMATVALCCGRLHRDHLMGLLRAGGVALLVALPFALPVLLAANGAAVQALDVDATGLSTMEMQQRASLSLPWSYLGIWASGAERSWRVPLLLLPGCLWATVWGRGAVRWVGLLGGLAAVLSAGPVLLSAVGTPASFGGYQLHLPQQWLNALPGYHRFWWPYRWQAVLLGAAVVCLPHVVQSLPRPRLWAVLISLWSMGEGAIMLRDGGVRPVMGPAMVPPVFVAMGKMDGPVRPILQMPSEWLRNSRVGWIAWHRQPIDGGMGWGMRVEDAEQRRAQLRQIPMVDAIHRAAAGETVSSSPSWSEEDAGGYHYVVLYATEGPTAERASLRRGAHAVLGVPFYDDGAVVVWAVPGVGEQP